MSTKKKLKVVARKGFSVLFVKAVSSNPKLLKLLVLIRETAWDFRCLIFACTFYRPNINFAQH